MGMQDLTYFLWEKNELDKNIFIRVMTDKDWDQVSRIYLEGIRTGIATFETHIPSWEEWNQNHLHECRLLAISNESITGWAALCSVSRRQVYSGVAEVSIYIANDWRNKGIGKFLLRNLILCSEENGVWTLQAGIFSTNTASIALHQSLGFRLVGFRERIGKLNGEWLDTMILERRSRIVGLEG
jgi:phosphinothricin acetyltransferase